MTIQQILKTYSPKLKSSSSILDIELLLCKILNKQKEYLYTYPEKKITSSQLTNFKKLFKRRANGEPIAYILGYQEFFGLNFKVNKNVLIPRPETEILVEQVIKFTKSHLPFAICDIGVGSGAIIISLTKTLNPRLNIRCIGTDISSKALSIAQQNAKANKVKITFLKGNLLYPLSPKLKAQSSKLIITANLPYLDKNEIKNQTIKNEPQLALDGGDDGLKYYRDFFEQIKKYNLKPQAIFLEIGHSQAKQIKKLAWQVLPKYKCKIKKDLCGFDRVVIIKK